MLHLGTLPQEKLRRERRPCRHSADVANMLALICQGCAKFQDAAIPYEQAFRIIMCRTATRLQHAGKRGRVTHSTSLSTVCFTSCSTSDLCWPPSAKTEDRASSIAVIEAIKSAVEPACNNQAKGDNQHFLLQTLLG